MKETYYNQIVLTHWNAGVFRSAPSQLLPELVIYPLLYKEVLIREEDLITNRVITRFLSDDNNFTIFSELLIAGLVTLLRLPPEYYPDGRKFDPARSPISARAEEHTIRRTYKGKPWTPTGKEWQLFQRLDQILTEYPCASRNHTPFPPENPFAAKLAEILDNRGSYQLASYRAFRHLDARTADQYSIFCHDPEAWRRFLHDNGVKNPITGPDAGFYRSAAYQCSEFLAAPRAIRRLVESVYAAAYCERELSDGRYGGSDLVELPYRYASTRERAAASESLINVEVVPTGVIISVTLQPGIARALAATRSSLEFKAMRKALQALGENSDSPLLTEERFQESWRNLCAVHAENTAASLTQLSNMDQRVTTYAVYIYILARVVGLHITATEGSGIDWAPLADYLVGETIQKFGPALLRGFRAIVRIPALQEGLEASIAIRCSTVPLAISETSDESPPPSNAER